MQKAFAVNKPRVSNVTPFTMGPLACYQINYQGPNGLMGFAVFNGKEKKDSPTRLIWIIGQYDAKQITTLQAWRFTRSGNPPQDPKEWFDEISKATGAVMQARQDQC